MAIRLIPAIADDRKNHEEMGHAHRPTGLSAVAGGIYLRCADEDGASRDGVDAGQYAFPRLDAEASRLGDGTELAWRQRRGDQEGRGDRRQGSRDPAHRCAPRTAARSYRLMHDWLRAAFSGVSLRAASSADRYGMGDHSNARTIPFRELLAVR